MEFESLVKSPTRPTRLVFVLLVLLVACGAPRALGQQFQDLPGPNPGAGYLGNG
ncbi:MAG: hypothetical protein JNG90_08945, partial [Planctomycetaceae bacterium]|nr:hypothetical protein [Planctomycetaceae bacterium]